MYIDLLASLSTVLGTTCLMGYKIVRILYGDTKEEDVTKSIPNSNYTTYPFALTSGTPFTVTYSSVVTGVTYMSKSPFSNLPASDPHGGKAYDESIKPKAKSPFENAPQTITVEQINNTLDKIIASDRSDKLTVQEYKDIETERQVAILNKNGGIVSAKSPLSRSTAVVIPGVDITKADIELLGNDVSRKVGETTKAIIGKMTVDRFGELGEILALVKVEADNLDPSTFFKGFFGFFKKQVTNVRAVLVERLENASSVFDQLKNKVAKQIAIQEEWIKDLDKIYAENIQHEKEIAATLKQAKDWRRLAQSAYDAFPTIDPDDDNAMLRMQEKRELEVIINRLSMKIDTFEKLRILAQSNAPRLIGQQNTCENFVMALRDTIDQTIPMIEREFAQYLADLDALKAGNNVSALRNLGDATLRKSADSSYNAATQSATILNQGMIKTDTLKYIQDKMISTIKDVRSIEDAAKVRRESDAAEMAQSQRAFILEVGQHVNAGQLASNRGRELI